VHLTAAVLLEVAGTAVDRDAMTRVKSIRIFARAHVWVHPMNAADAKRQLQEIADAGDDFEWQTGQLTAKWKDDPNGCEAVEPILQFMENHPEVDYGTPGPLVLFVEAFSCYERKLIESIQRKPTPNTVGMLNRVINSKSDPQQRRTVISVLEGVVENLAADAMTRSRASYYLDYLRRDHRLDG
jgi:hypothetical protein